MAFHFPVAEVTTTVWFIFSIQLFIRYFLFKSIPTYSAKLQFTLSWLLYCVPIHLHGFIPFYRNKEMMHMENYPDIYFGAYGRYCKADPRYCGNDIFIQMIQGGTALFLTPLCALSLVGIIRRSPWRHGVLIMVSFVQMLQTVYFFIQPFKLESNPIPQEGVQFYFDYLFMNSLWVVIPIWLIFGSMVQISKAQSQFDNKNHDLMMKKKK